MSRTRHWGSTAEERTAAFPCDDFVEGDAGDNLFRAIDVAAPPAVVFRWLCQLRVAPYSYDLLDNFGRTSPRTLTPGVDQLARGQRVMTIFELVDFDPDHHLTIVLRRGRALIGDAAVTYRVTAVEPPASGSRLVVKIRLRRPRGPFRLLAPLMPAGDLLMMRKQLLTLKRLAERDSTVVNPASRSTGGSR